MSYPELQVCPFCAHTGELTDSAATRAFDGAEAFGYTVLCNAARGGCGATCGYWETEAEAIEHWNDRAGPPAVRESESEVEARWRHDRFLALKRLLELNDTDEGTAMNTARARIARLTAVEDVFEGVLSDPARVYGALSTLAREDLSQAQVALVLAAARELVQARRPDVLRITPQEPAG